MPLLRYLILSIGAALAAQAVTISYSPPVGGVTKPAAADSDTLVSVILTRPPAWRGVASSSTNETISVATTPNWSINLFAGSELHYVRMLSGNLRGHYFIITGNTADTLILDSAGLNLGLIASGDVMEIVPFWTLGTLFPNSQAGIAYTSTTVPVLTKTQLLFFDATAVGINRPASSTYYHYNGAWRKVGQPSNISYDNMVIYPDTFFIQRNSTAATALAYTGRVQPSYLGTVLEASITQNDNFVAIAYPIDITLDQLGLTSNSFTPTTVPVLTKDQLLWFDPDGNGTNRPAVHTYYYYNGAWRRVGASSSIDYGSVVLKAGSGFIIRKAANGISAPFVFSTGL